MGKKQKMKKAAAAAAAAAAAKPAVEQQAAAAVEQQAAAAFGGANKSNDKNVCNSEDNNNAVGDKKNELRAMANMMKLKNLTKTMKSKPSTSHKSQESSVSVSSDSENSDSDDAATVVQQCNVKSNGKKTAGHSIDIPEFLPIPKFSRGEKKARRLLMKLDLEKIPNVSRVTMRKAKNVLLCIDQPEVYKCPNTKTIICFGEVRVEDTSNAAAAQAAERYLNDANVRDTSSQSKDGDQLNDSKSDIDEDDDNDEDTLDDSQLDDKDIDLVQMQAECSRQKAIKALLKHKSDVVNAIMDLTVG